MCEELSYKAKTEQIHNLTSDYIDGKMSSLYYLNRRKDILYRNPSWIEKIFLVN